MEYGEGKIDIKLNCQSSQKNDIDKDLSEFYEKGTPTEWYFRGKNISAE